MTVIRAVLLGLVAGIVVCLHPLSASAQRLVAAKDGSLVSENGRARERFDPRFNPGEIVVSFGDRRLYYVTGVGEAIGYPIAVPRDEDRWSGTTTISYKRLNPSWRPTAEMLAENPRLPPWIPGGHPKNPLGTRALYLGSSAYRIHGTDAPETIGNAVSRGCIRMYNQDVVDLFTRVAVGTRVTVTWRRIITVPGFAARRNEGSFGHGG